MKRPWWPFSMTEMPAFTQTGFTAQSNSQVAAAYGADNHNMRGGTGSASWTFTGLADGEYQVAATWAS